MKNAAEGGKQVEREIKPMKVVPLLVGDWTRDEWEVAEQAVFSLRGQYPPDSLSAIYRDIAIGLQIRLARTAGTPETAANAVWLSEYLDEVGEWRPALTQEWFSEQEGIERARRYAEIGDKRLRMSRYWRTPEAATLSDDLNDVLDEMDEYLDNRQDADFEGERFIPNKELKLLGRLRIARLPAPPSGEQGLPLGQEIARRGRW
jgi:hypothetical protein